jgi:hypothetical protein
MSDVAEKTMTQQASSEGVTVKQAVAAAFRAAQEYAGPNLLDLRLEEVQRDGLNWYITLSYLVPDNKPRRRPIITSIVPEAPPVERVYKVFDVNEKTGHVGSMTMREP